jgi:predicted nucleotidyltransferase
MIHHSEPPSYLELLRQRTQREWPAIRAAQQEAERKLQLIRTELQAASARIDSEDVSIVVFGSVARGESTPFSDLDWTLIIDGQADPGHAATARQFAESLTRSGIKAPNVGGAFGNLAFSHVLIHQIGGEDDTNRNLTERMLLFLESVPVDRREAYDRVIIGILNRYLANQRPLTRYKVPRFLLNDVVRYWRTMCVDFANKFRTRAGQGWAVRNIKLRLSRKLLFTSGLLSCFGCDEEMLRAQGAAIANGPPTLENLLAHLQQYVKRTPLDILAEALYRYGTPQTAMQTLDAYDGFLAVLADQEYRKHLEDLDPSQTETDKRFQAAYALTRSFEQGLQQLFFTDHPLLNRLTQKYGVF